MLKKYYYMKELRLKLNDCVQANVGSNFSKNEFKGDCLQNRKNRKCSVNYKFN